jgi:UDP:flavonoid glycosyltransferase YjiC (YdhE family)
MTRTLLVTVGSLGDLHPYLAMAKALRDAGHGVRVATHAHYRDKVERLGVEFVDFPPSAEELPPESEWVPRVNAPRKGSEYVIRRIVLPFLERSYDVLLDASRDCDRVVSHLLAFAVPLVAEKRGIPWHGCFLQPSVLFSVDDPPVLGVFPHLPRLRRIGRWPVRAFYRLMASMSASWFAPVEALRRREGLPPSPGHPLLAMGSPHGNVALFPEAFAPRQHDWPPGTIAVGFPLDDEDGRGALSADLERFLADGAAPVVFTLGSAVSESENAFFREAYAAVRATGSRAVFVAGAKRLGVPSDAARDDAVLVVDYARYSDLFPRARAIVHQCGIGTTAQALAAGKPQLCVPFAHDQPDNAARVARLGAGTVVPAMALGRGKLAGALRWLLADERFTRRAREIAPDVRDGRFAERLLRALQSPRSDATTFAGAGDSDYVER